MKTFLLFAASFFIFQTAWPQAKPKTQNHSTFVFEVDAVRNLDNDEIDPSSCQVTKQANKIIWKTDETTLVFTITKTVWKSKTTVEYHANRGNVEARWVFKEANGQQRIAFFTESIAMEMHVADSYTR